MNWDPFIVCQPNQSPPKPRDIHSKEGIGDRMRSAAFAELQATRAFKWASEHFNDVPEQLKDDWARVSKMEQDHLDAIIKRMDELEISLQEKPVSSRLWDSLMKCKTGKEFCLFISSAEERGRQAGVKLCQAIKKTDPITAAVFEKIVEEEVEHIALAQKYYIWKP